MWAQELGVGGGGGEDDYINAFSISSKSNAEKKIK